MREMPPGESPNDLSYENARDFEVSRLLCIRNAFGMSAKNFQNDSVS